MWSSHILLISLLGRLIFSQTNPCVLHCEEPRLKKIEKPHQSLELHVKCSVAFDLHMRDDCNPGHIFNLAYEVKTFSDHPLMWKMCIKTWDQLHVIHVGFRPRFQSLARWIMKQNSLTCWFLFARTQQRSWRHLIESRSFLPQESQIGY